MDVQTKHVLFMAVACLSTICGTRALPSCTVLLEGDPRFAGCQELCTGNSAVLWANSGPDAITIKYTLQEGATLGWMGLGFNVHGSMTGEVAAVLQNLQCRLLVCCPNE
jgi:hypothetical protein